VNTGADMGMLLPANRRDIRRGVDESHAFSSQGSPVAWARPGRRRPGGRRPPVPHGPVAPAAVALVGSRRGATGAMAPAGGSLAGRSSESHRDAPAPVVRVWWATEGCDGPIGGHRAASPRWMPHVVGVVGRSRRGRGGPPEAVTVLRLRPARPPELLPGQYYLLRLESGIRRGGGAGVSVCSSPFPPLAVDRHRGAGGQRRSGLTGPRPRVEPGDLLQIRGP